MKRRSFVGALAALLAAPKLVKLPKPEPTDLERVEAVRQTWGKSDVVVVERLHGVGARAGGDYLPSAGTPRYIVRGKR